MRPVRLDLEGFAAFRDRAVVDFTDADYFALVGPTGSGKSTVIDAMTFALYGSAPRWGSIRSVQYALAPTVNRATVRLVFDVADQRYAVAREVRRSGKQIAQKNCTLERYADPEATGDLEADEPTEVLAGDAKAVLERIIDLLGLDFEDFCTCVVLPQGDFATFLTASVAQRQDILLKLLGARHYETIGRLANRRAADATARIDALQGQLVGYADATDENEAAARERESDLAALLTAVTGEVETLSGGLGLRAEIAARVDRTAAQLGLLSAVQTPDDVADLQRRLTDADRAYGTASDAERAAGEALADAEDALRAGPAPGPLEETLRWHADWARESARTAEVAAAREQASVACATARAAAVAAEQQLDEARTQHERCRAGQRRAADSLEELTERIETLQAVTAPEGTADLDQAVVAARADRDEADALVEAAEAAVIEAQTRLAGLPERSALAGLQRTVVGYATAAEQRAELRRESETVTAELAEADAAMTRARTDRGRAQDELEALRTQTVAADLRPHLRIGHACPVCDQAVATLPPPLAAPELDSARAQLADIEDRVRVCEAAVAGPRHRLAELTAQQRATERQLAEQDQLLLQELPGQPAGPDRDIAADRAAVLELQTRWQGAVAAQESAVRQRDAARDGQRRAEQELTRVSDATGRSWAALHTAQGRLAALGAPMVTADGLADAWSALVGWAAELAARLEATDLAAAVVALDEAAHALQEASDRLQVAVQTDRATAEELTAASVAEEKARTEQTDLVRRLAELQTKLTDRPGETEAQRLLAEHRRLGQQAELARSAARAAALTRQRTENVRDRCRAEREAARSSLHLVREPLIGLGAPTIDDTDLDRAWSQLTTWADATAERLRTEFAGAQADLAARDGELVDGLARLTELIAEHGLTSTIPSVAEFAGPESTSRLARIPTEVELERERARAATAQLVRRRREAETLRTAIATDRETEQVGRALAQLMSARRFPQWLADASLDTLVAGASASLLRLSGGQFELSHERGEFYVIDHADADSLRSVKTLSGGETFQASLALALALSEQLSTLAAGGRTTLDSIFLDEGFGTLDPDALEIVASTLENLAQGNRMVGVVTHVAALAERAPVRFEVSRDSRTSRIERVGA